MKRRRRRGGRVENNSSPLRQPAAGKKSRCFLELAAIGTWKAARERERDKKQEGSGSNNSHFSTSLPFFFEKWAKGGKREVFNYLYMIPSFLSFLFDRGRPLVARKRNDHHLSKASRVLCSNLRERNHHQIAFDVDKTHNTPSSFTFSLIPRYTHANAIKKRKRKDFFLPKSPFDETI